MIDLIVSKDEGYSSKPYEGTKKCEQDGTFRLHYIKFNLMDASQLGRYHITVSVVRNQDNVNSLYEYSSTIRMDEFADILSGNQIKDDLIKPFNEITPIVIEV